VKNYMFKLIYSHVAGPQGNFNVNSAMTFEGGQVGVVSGTAAGDPEVILAGSGSTGLLGMIDDDKETSFTAAVVDEVVVSGQTTVSKANIVNDGSVVAFDSVNVGETGGGSVVMSVAQAVNGEITNTLTDGTANVSYSYVIPGKAGDDTTLASGRTTLWLAEGEYATDVYEIADGVAISSYSVNAPLYVADDTNGQAGRLSSEDRSGTQQVVAYVTKAPTAGNTELHFFKVNLG
jgi:hypothetical protein